MESLRSIPLPVIGICLLIIGLVAVPFIEQYQTYPQTPEVTVFSYASPESQGLSAESVTELADAVARSHDPFLKAKKAFF